MEAPRAVERERGQGSGGGCKVWVLKTSFSQSWILGGSDDDEVVEKIIAIASEVGIEVDKYPSKSYKYPEGLQ